jgi:hypothetical protein
MVKFESAELLDCVVASGIQVRMGMDAWLCIHPPTTSSFSWKWQLIYNIFFSPCKQLYYLKINFFKGEILHFGYAKEA